MLKRSVCTLHYRPQKRGGQFNEKKHSRSIRAFGSHVDDLLISTFDGATEIVAGINRDVNEAMPKALSRFGFRATILEGRSIIFPDVIKPGLVDRGGLPRTKEDRFTAATAAAVKIVSRHQRKAREQAGCESAFADAFAP